MTAPAPVLTLDYAHPQSLGSIQGQIAFRRMFVLSILSGLCVGSCFLTFMETLIAVVIHVAIFTLTIVWAVRAGMGLMQMMSSADDPSRRRRMILDLLALVGIAIIGAAPVVYHVGKTRVTDDHLFTAALGTAYSLLALGTARHVMLYRLLAGLCRTINRQAMARSLITLGWFKAIYEVLWLGCCAATLLMIAAKDVGLGQDAAIFFAVPALFGIAGFALIWIWMMICHGRLITLAK